MSKYMPGPHHCASASLASILSVFEFLKKCAVKYHGRLSVADLERLEVQFVRGRAGDMKAFRETNDHCYSTFQSPGAKFDSRKLACILLRQHIGLKSIEVFKIRDKNVRLSWSLQFYLALIDYMKEYEGKDLTAQISARYDKLAPVIGRYLTHKDCLEDYVLARNLDNLVIALRALRTDEDAIETLSEFINGRLDHHFKITGPNQMRVSDKSVRDFLFYLEANQRFPG